MEPGEGQDARLDVLEAPDEHRVPNEGVAGEDELDQPAPVRAYRDLATWVVGGLF